MGRRPLLGAPPPPSRRSCLAHDLRGRDPRGGGPSRRGGGAVEARWAGGAAAAGGGALRGGGGGGRLGPGRALPPARPRRGGRPRVRPGAGPGPTKVALPGRRPPLAISRDGGATWREAG